MSRGNRPGYGAPRPPHTQAELPPLRFQPPDRPLLTPFRGHPHLLHLQPTQYVVPNVLSHPDTSDRGGVDEETEEGDSQSESDWSETSSRRSASSVATTASNNTILTTSTNSEFYDTEWAYHRCLRLDTLEDLRGGFESELLDPSAWTLQRIVVLTRASRLYEAEEKVRNWLRSVADATRTPAGRRLRLPPLRRYSPFHRILTWEEADALDGEERELCFGRDVGEDCKRIARLLILFLFPEVSSRGLFACDKEMIFDVASQVWLLDPPRAEGLLWALDNEYPKTREGLGRRRANPNSKEFMIYAVLYPPPIVPSH